MNQELPQNKTEETEKTNWTAWYIGLIGFLVLQIAIYLWISNSFDT